MTKSFTAQEIAQIQKLLREAAGEPAESCDTDAVVGMLSDEIETLRRQGMTDGDIAALLTQGAGATITAEQVAEFYAPPQDRAKGPSPNDVDGHRSR